MDNLDNSLVFTNENILTQLYYRQVMGENYWFELTLGRNFSRMHANVNGNDDFTHLLAAADQSRRRVPTRPTTTPTAGTTTTPSRGPPRAPAFMGGKPTSSRPASTCRSPRCSSSTSRAALGSPPPGKLAVGEDIFMAHPVTGSAYFQDTARYRGLIVNAGARVDVWAPGKEVE